MSISEGLLTDYTHDLTMKLCTCTVEQIAWNSTYFRHISSLIFPNSVKAYTNAPEILLLQLMFAFALTINSIKQIIHFISTRHSLAAAPTLNCPAKKSHENTFNIK